MFWCWSQLPHRPLRRLMPTEAYVKPCSSANVWSRLGSNMAASFFNAFTAPVVAAVCDSELSHRMPVGSNTRTWLPVTRDETLSPVPASKCIWWALPIWRPCKISVWTGRSARIQSFRDSTNVNAVAYETQVGIETRTKPVCVKLIFSDLVPRRLYKLTIPISSTAICLTDMARSIESKYCDGWYQNGRQLGLARDSLALA